MNKKALHKISYGMYIVSSKNGDKLNGQIANSVFQITSTPITIAISINKENLTNEFLKSNGIFSVSILSKETPIEFIGKFGFKSGRDINKFDGVNYKIGESGAPVVLDYAIAYLECKVKNSIDAGTHTIFIGEVIEGDILKDEVPMTYEYYHSVKKGGISKNAPHYIEEEKKETPRTDGTKKYRCKVCGYIYDPEVGDPDGGIAPGTPFEDIPDDWVCPVCGAAKSDFEEV